MNQIYLCLFATLLCGLWCCVIGATMAFVLPMTALDAILTPVELADEALQSRVSDSISRATFRIAMFWFGTGLFLLVVSGYGLRVAASETKAEP